MKKLTAILFACTMFICSAVSCGDKNDGEASSDSKTKVTTAAEETTAEKTTEKTDSDNKDDDKDDDDKNDGEKEDENAGIVDKEASDDVIKEMNAAVTEFAEMTLRGDADELINSMYPKKIADAIINSEFASSFEDASDLMGSSNGKLVESKAEKIKELNADALRGAEKYFESVADMMSVDKSKYEVEKGYYLTMNIDIRRDGVRDGGEEEACFVYIKDEGWKYVPVKPSELIELLERDSESEPEEVPAARSDD